MCAASSATNLPQPGVTVHGSLAGTLAARSRQHMLPTQRASCVPKGREGRLASWRCSCQRQGCQMEWPPVGWPGHSLEAGLHVPLEGVQGALCSLGAHAARIGQDGSNSPGCIKPHGPTCPLHERGCYCLQRRARLCAWLFSSLFSSVILARAMPYSASVTTFLGTG